MAPIAVGDSLPEGTLAYFDAEDQLQQVSVHSLAAGKKVVLFGVPGAFTPTCRYKCLSAVAGQFPRDFGILAVFADLLFCYDRNVELAVI